MSVIVVIYHDDKIIYFCCHGGDRPFANHASATAEMFITYYMYILLLLLQASTYLRAAKVNHIGESEAQFSRS